MTVPKLYTLDEVAELTHAPKRSVVHWVQSGKLKSVKAGKRRLVSEAQLMQFLDFPPGEMEVPCAH
jgi:excisionase family DNA binding protein